MNRTVFIEFLDWFKQQTAGRKVLLIIDGYRAHHTGLDLWRASSSATDNIRVEFLPPNTTSHSQPLDQGIIRAWKAYYRRQWVQFQANSYEKEQDLYKAMNVLLAVRWGIKAWQECITDTTIANCWLKSRVLGPQMTPITRWQAERSGWQEAVNAEETKLATTIQQIKAILHTFKDQDRIKDMMDIDQFIDPMTEKVEDLIDGTNLVKDIIASYSLTPEDVPDEEIDPGLAIVSGYYYH
jgi:hypothetical protein